MKFVIRIQDTVEDVPIHSLPIITRGKTISALNLWVLRERPGWIWNADKRRIFGGYWTNEEGTCFHIT